MKRTIFAFATVLVVLLAAFAMFVLRPVPKVKAHRSCSNSTLSGDYGATVYGNQQGAPGPLTNVVLLNFDGSGSFSGTEAYAITGFKLSGPSANNFTGGTYDVNPDCSMSFTVGTTVGQGVVVNADGREVIGQIFTPCSSCPSTPNAVAAIFDVKKIADFEDH
jgi:hypothetical protein